MALKTPISILQELMVSKKEALPIYQIESVGNQLIPQFCCTVETSSVTVVATATTKKEAKQRAAEKALIQLRKLENNPDDIKKSTSSSSVKISCSPPKMILHSNISTSKDFHDGVNYIGNLNEYAQQNNCSTAIKYENSMIIGTDQYQVRCLFGTKETVGYGINKKVAKQIAAFEMIKIVKSSNYKAPSNLQTSTKIESTCELDSKVIEKFKELSTPTGTFAAKDIQEIESFPVKREKQYTLEEGEEQLKKLKLTYKVRTIGNNQEYIVAVSIVENAVTSLGRGNSKEMAIVDAMNKVLEALSSGCSFAQ